jgi:hypothetical protein
MRWGWSRFRTSRRPCGVYHEAQVALALKDGM